MGATATVPAADSTAAVHVMSLRHRNRRHVRAGRSVVHDRYLLDAVVQLREQFAQAMGARITDIAEMDLAVAHLRVPETV